MSMEIRGGKPRTFELSVDLAGFRYGLPFLTKHVQVFAEGNGVDVFWTAEDFEGGTNPLPVAAGASYEGPAEIEEIYLKGRGGTSTVRVVVFDRR